MGCRLATIVLAAKVLATNAGCCSLARLVKYGFCDYAMTDFKFSKKISRMRKNNESVPNNAQPQGTHAGIVQNLSCFQLTVNFLIRHSSALEGKLKI